MPHELLLDHLAAFAKWKIVVVLKFRLPLHAVQPFLAPRIGAVSFPVRNIEIMVTNVGHPLTAPRRRAWRARYIGRYEKPRRCRKQNAAPDGARHVLDRFLHVWSPADPLISALSIGWRPYLIRQPRGENGNRKSSGVVVICLRGESGSTCGLRMQTTGRLPSDQRNYWSTEHHRHRAFH